MTLKMGSFSRYFLKLNSQRTSVTCKYVKKVANENGFWKMVTENLSQGLGPTIILSSFGADKDSKVIW